MKTRAIPLIPAILLCSLLALGVQARQQSATVQAPSSADSVTIPGQLTAKQAEAFEKLLKETPDDVNTREQLASYYFFSITGNTKDPAAMEHLQDHVFWLIEHRPESEWSAMGGSEICTVGAAEACAHGKQLWLEQIQRSPDNIQIVQNAARYLLNNDQTLAGELLEKALALNPQDPNTNSQFAEILEVQRVAGKSAAAQTQLAQRALALRETAYAHIDADRKLSELQHVAVDAFNGRDFAKAEATATELVDLASRNPGDWDYGDEIHMAHTVLGLTSLNRGDVTTAKKELLASADTPGSPTLVSFGPTFYLAQQLLAKGEPDTVVAYLEACFKFWEMGRNSLKDWISQIKSGATPNFGHNLLF